MADGSAEGAPFARPSPSARVPSPVRLTRPPPAPSEDDAEQQADERCALEAIYGEGFLQGVGDATYRACIPSAAAQPHLALTLHLPARYPSLHPPVFQLQCDYVPSDALDALASRLEALFVPGTPAVSYCSGLLWTAAWYASCCMQAGCTLRPERLAPLGPLQAASACTTGLSACARAG